MRENEFVEEQEYALAIKGEWRHSDNEYQHTYITASTLQEAVSKATEEVKGTGGATGEFILEIDGRVIATGEYLGKLKPEEGGFNGEINL